MQLEERLAAGAPTEDGLVFVTVRGLPVRGSNLMPPFHAALASLGLPAVTIHSLRHSAASALIASGYPIAKVAAILGHSSSRVTEMVYSHLTGKDTAEMTIRVTGSRTIMSAINVSFSSSRLAVPSSRNRASGSRYRARASMIRWRWVFFVSVKEIMEAAGLTVTGEA